MKTIEQLTKSYEVWYSSNDEELWHGGPYDNKEEADQCSFDEEHVLICKASKTPFRVSQFFDVDRFFEDAEESIFELGSEDGEPMLDFKADVVADLQSRVRAAIDEWQVAHQLSPVPWSFDGSYVTQSAFGKEEEERIKSQAEEAEAKEPPFTQPTGAA